MDAKVKKSKIIASRLRISREQAGLSQGQVAKMLNYHRPTISEIEAGRRKVKADEISKFAKIYGVSTSWLLSADIEEVDESRDKIELAARELTKLKSEDLDSVIKFLRSLCEKEE